MPVSPAQLVQYLMDQTVAHFVPAQTDHTLGMSIISALCALRLKPIGTVAVACALAERFIMEVIIPVINKRLLYV